jgi:hypothetical protein
MGMLEWPSEGCDNSLDAEQSSHRSAEIVQLGQLLLSWKNVLAAHKSKKKNQVLAFFLIAHFLLMCPILKQE